ncbi:hypothetical protein LZ32DRAFT_441499 [Colletotrichum eremochloae]|nr:hypothetical protein LZ32DRAFT_441499 [Colletotrichum eremochloae]
MAGEGGGGNRLCGMHLPWPYAAFAFFSVYDHFSDETTPAKQTTGQCGKKRPKEKKKEKSRKLISDEKKKEKKRERERERAREFNAPHCTSSRLRRSLRLGKTPPNVGDSRLEKRRRGMSDPGLLTDLQRRPKLGGRA